MLVDEKDTAGLPDDVKTAAAEAAKARGKSGQWAIQNTRSSVEPFLCLPNDANCEKVWRMFVGGDGGAHDNNPLITEILMLRAKRAKLLGYATHAHWRARHAMAQMPECAERRRSGLEVGGCASP